MLPSPAAIVVFFVVTCLVFFSNAELKDEDPCANYSFRDSCRAAGCLWSGEFCVAPSLDFLTKSSVAPAMEEGCISPKYCTADQDCCLGLVCRTISSVSENRLDTVETKTCVAPELLPPAPSESSSTKECPDAGSFVTISAGPQELATSNDLCTLTRITKDRSGNILAVVPLARSYSGNDWEQAAGKVAAELNLQSTITCSSNKCSIVLPKLNDSQESYRLSSYEYELPTRDKRARFLEMTTFGTTKQDLDSWNYNNEAEWVKEQMELPMTSHREYFRQRANPRWTFSQKVGRSDHPCDKNSRWRRFTFTRKDKYKDDDDFASGYLYVKNTTYTKKNGKDVPGGPYILTIDGHPRTVVQDWKWQNDWVNDKFPYWDPDYGYEFCSSPDEFTKGAVYLRTKPFGSPPQGTCRGVDADIGNPAINFTGFESLMGPYVFRLDDGDLTLIDEWQDAGTSRGDDLYILKNGLFEDQCESLPEQNEDFDLPVFGLHPTEGLLQWDSRLRLEQNTLDSPIPDGGGSLEAATQGKTFCSNVPRTFQNFDSCILSKQDTTCGSVSSMEATIELDSNNLLQLHSLTGRYVYAIQGLQVRQREFQYFLEHPCTPGLQSRWERQAGVTCENPTNLRQSTRKALRRLIAVSNDANPFIRDIIFPSDGTECDSRDVNLIIELQVGTDCWTRVHDEHLSVFDMTYWTSPNIHPGGAKSITKWLDNGQPFLVFPGEHPTDSTMDHSMDRWVENDQKFQYIGRFGDSIRYKDLPSDLQVPEVAEYYGAVTSEEGTGVMVCGSPGEVENDETLGSAFDMSSHWKRDTTYSTLLGKQREVVWTMISLYGKDQLRQRMAWALSQILVIAKGSIEKADKSTEIFLSFYDILVKHSFGNYLDILREISYSPMMAENLSFIDSKSSAYVYEKFARRESADENFSREILQLFTTGLIFLNLDGTPKLDFNGNTMQVYDNDDIRSFARAWTGFSRQNERGNYEEVDNSNRLDPMRIHAEWRDRFPKSDLYGGFIGDRYPLCVDLPPKQFLRKGAKYRLLGSSAVPELVKDDPLFTKRFALNKESSLFSVLCTDKGSGCQFPNEVTLDKNVPCNGKECDVDALRVIRATPGVFYEYVRPPCVEHPFFNNAMKLNKEKDTRAAICGNPLLPVATSACCEADSRQAISDTLYEIERMTFATQEKRCQALGRRSCEYSRVDKDAVGYWLNDVVYHWAVTPCTIQVKVNLDGEAAIVHNMPVETDGKVLHVNDDTENYFGVRWADGLYPQQAINDCGVCTTVEGDKCLCETSVEESIVFSSDPDSIGKILFACRIGAPDPSSFDDGTYSSTSVNGFIVHKFGGKYNMETIFEVEDSVGRTHFLKNAKSTVYLKNNRGVSAGFSFRNPVQFMSLVPSETNVRDAMHETEAVLEHYFYHDNTAPFLCTRFIQRFGISNASPRYVRSCARAFRNGSYEWGGTKFGTGRYGDLAATVASIVLDREVRNIVVDMDPAFGSIREPILRVFGFLRGMEFEPKASSLPGETPLVVFDDLDTYIGQMAYEFPTVFSFFLPEYVPDGPVYKAGLVSPEAQLLDMPKVIDLINGMHSLIKYGLSSCYEDESSKQYGFGHPSDPEVGSGKCTDNGKYNRATGTLTYQAFGASSTEIVDELATILTSGRLNSKSRRLLVTAYEKATASDGEEAGLRLAQQLLTTSPEFHTNVPVKLSGEKGSGIVPPIISDVPYKAVVYLMLAGGCDSYNMLVPNKCDAPNDDADAYTKYVEARNPAHLLTEDLLPIDGSGQVNCDTFGVHKKLPIVQELYNEGDLLFFANTGVIGRPSNRSNYKSRTPTQLFAHNFMQRETKTVDLFNEAAGVGVLGRLTDALAKLGLNTGSISLDTSSEALSGTPGLSPTPFVVSQYGVKRFMPQDSQSMNKQQMTEAIRNLNNATTEDSGFMANTWSRSLFESLFQNEELYNALEGTDVDAEFGDTDLGRKLEIVSKMIKTRTTRGSDVDVFYVEIGGFDTHSDVEVNLKELFSEVNSGLTGFVNEMKNQNLWDNVVVVQASEFARTLSPNSGAGTDHAWGGNYFMCGGSVKGERILGEYPSDMSESSEINAGRGRLIPTTSWDQIWPGIAQFTGITRSEDFDDICPNRGNFPFVYSAGDLFDKKIPDTSLPTSIPGPGEEGGEGEGGGEPTQSPSEPSTSGSTQLICTIASLCSFLSALLLLVTLL